MIGRYGLLLHNQTHFQEFLNLCFVSFHDLHLMFLFD